MLATCLCIHYAEVVAEKNRIAAERGRSRTERSAGDVAERGESGDRDEQQEIQEEHHGDDDDVTDYSSLGVDSGLGDRGRSGVQQWLSTQSSPQAQGTPPLRSIACATPSSTSSYPTDLVEETRAGRRRGAVGGKLTHFGKRAFKLTKQDKMELNACMAYFVYQGKNAMSKVENRGLAALPIIGMKILLRFVSFIFE